MTDFKSDKVWLMQGDCLERMKEIPDGSVDLILTDPPYGTTACKWDSIIDLGLMWKELKRVIKPKGAIIMTASQPFTTTLIGSNLKDFKYCWYWKKNRATGVLNAKRQPLRDTEDICVFNVKQYNPQGLVKYDKPSRNGKKDSSVYGKGQTKSYTQEWTNYPKQSLNFNSVQRTIHPTQKPVDLLEYLIKTYTNEGETVLDFTMGSGSTIKAALNTNRKSIGIELGQCEKKNSEYFEVDWTDVIIDQLDLKEE